MPTLPVLSVQTWKHCLPLEGWCAGVEEEKENAQALPGGHLLLIFLEGKKGLLHRALLLSLLLCKQSGLLKAALFNLR